MEHRRRGSIVVGGLLVALIAVVAAAAAPPANDAFPGTSLAGERGTVTGTTAEATAETGEPGELGGLSVWYTWQAPATGAYGFCSTPGTALSAPDTVLGVWTGGALSTLARSAFNDDGGWDSVGSFVLLDATAGETYRVAVGVYDGPAGPFTLTWKPGECQPPNSAITEARVKGKRLQFWFAGADNATPAAGLTFECRLDSKPWTPCTSPASLDGSKGTHTAYVRATDGNGNTEAFPASVMRVLKGPAER